MVVEPDGTDGTSRVAALAGLRARRVLTQQAAARLFVDVHFPPFLVLQLDLVVFQRLDNGQRLDMRDAGFQQPLTTVLELLLNEESHTHQCGTGLLAQILNSQPRIAVGQEVVDKQHAVLGQQVFTADNQRRVLVFGKRVHRGRQEFTHRRRLLLLGKHHGQLHQVAQHHRRCYARCLDGHNLRHAGTGKTREKLHRHLFHQAWIHLVVHESVHFQDATLQTIPVLQYSVN